MVVPSRSFPSLWAAPQVPCSSVTRRSERLTASTLRAGAGPHLACVAGTSPRGVPRERSIPFQFTRPVYGGFRDGDDHEMAPALETGVTTRQPLPWRCAEPECGRQMCTQLAVTGSSLPLAGGSA